MTRSSDRPGAGASLDERARMHERAPQADKATVYARFIPREELGSFAVWSPSALSGGSAPNPNSGVQRPAAKPKPAEPVQPRQDVDALVRAARQSGYQDGYRDGLVALEAFKTTFMNQMMGQFGSMAGHFEAQLDEIQHEMARALVRTATQLARQVVRSELKTQPELIVTVANEALGVLLTSARHITVRVHPDDLNVVAQGAGETLAARNARLIPDASVTRGGCMVDSDLGVVEANIETRWRRAAEQLGNREAYDEPMSAASLADSINSSIDPSINESNTGSTDDASARSFADDKDLA